MLSFLLTLKKKKKKKVVSVSAFRRNMDGKTIERI